ncbi:DUF664 domain-containing protein [Streptomyces benahoarensis]|uniref:DUF664 domain-containing protein n=1 Tax=Streptomyces benahoarensis TaxID=2595054 RepID=A0A553ZNS9_9ACTN|nr:DUF664 domain-containing protein [Streptomyces benahoarensis]TSB43127.1 DUF664 domain-containing protein [Streptomyces benahoarensis]
MVLNPGGPAVLGIAPAIGRCGILRVAADHQIGVNRHATAPARELVQRRSNTSPAWNWVISARRSAARTADETREQIVELYRRAWRHSDATITALPLDAVGQVPWWPTERREVTLHHLLIHMTAETHRHAGHADIVRELIDGAAGMRDGNTNLPSDEGAWWQEYRDRLEHVAREAAGRG